MELHLFGGRPWDALTDDELDIVARAIVRASQSASYSLSEVCLHILLDVNQLDVLYGNADATKDDDEGDGYRLEQVYWLQRRDRKEPPFALPAYMLHYWIKPKKEQGAGMFDWLLAGSRRMKPPKVPVRSLFAPRFAAPKKYMSDWTWQQYRAVTDYYEQYVRVSNAVHRGALGAAYLDDARAQWLATIFCRRVWYRDDDGIIRFGHHYATGQAMRNHRYFRRTTDTDFQKILLWWEGMQYHLQQQYPKCFKKGAPPAKSDPLSIYSRSIATLEKYSGSNEETINRKTYTVVLQQLNDMVLQNEEYEKLKNR